LRRAANPSETYFRKTRPSARCLYSADSTLPRSALAASKRSFSEGMSLSWATWTKILAGAANGHIEH
jgi:hypothetical protein